ncbi:MAG: VWA domain-containing protein [Bacteroidales bacterium]|nr:VWA domain-containing protein [Bacteroidales bacterium]
MLQLENSYFLYGLILIPFFIILFFSLMRWKRKALKRFGTMSVINRLIPDFSKEKSILKFIFLIIAYVFLIIGLANPQIGSKLVKGERKGIDIMIALDVSNSMLAEDIQPNRLEKAKQAISKLIDKLKNDRIGIIVFAGKAYTQLPITSDYAAAKMFLSTIDPTIVPVQGTAISEAIRLATKSFNDENHNKAIIIITDGEDHEGQAIEETKQAVDVGISVFTIGMGLPDGSPIPLYNGNKRLGYKKDNNGNTVVTKLNESILQQIASEGNGIYVRANNTSAGLRTIFQKINKIEKKEYESRVFSDFESRFQYFIGISIILLIIELLIVERKSKWSGKIKLFQEK